MTTTVRGKMVTSGGGQRRFFPAVDRDPGGALDSALPEPEPTLDERERALDAREAALDELEADDDQGRTDAEARDRKIARDGRRAARIKRARDARRGARDDTDWPTAAEREAESGRDRGARRAGRDALPDPKDHRRDFRSGSADSMAHDRAGRSVDVGAIFGRDQHAPANRQE